MLIEENKTDETLSLTAYRAGAIEAGGKTYTAPIIWRNGKIEAMNVQTPSEPPKPHLTALKKAKSSVYWT